MSFRSLSRTWTCWALLLSSAWVAGCVITSSEEPSVVKYGTEADFCAALARAECSDAVVGACYGSDDASLEEDRGNCVSARSVSCQGTDLTYAADPAAAEACIQKRAAVLSDAKITLTEQEEAEEICLGVYAGNGQTGDSCLIHTDCSTTDGLRCVVKPGAATGACAIPAETGGGSKCDAPEAVCVEGFYCSGDTAELANYCIERPGEGEACSDAQPCLEALRCSLPVDGVCIAKFSNGSPCTLDGECSGGFCIKGTGQTTGACAGEYRIEFTAQSCEDFRQ